MIISVRITQSSYKELIKARWRTSVENSGTLTIDPIGRACLIEWTLANGDFSMHSSLPSANRLGATKFSPRWIRWFPGQAWRRWLGQSCQRSCRYDHRGYRLWISVQFLEEDSSLKCDYANFPSIDDALEMSRACQRIWWPLMQYRVDARGRRLHRGNYLWKYTPINDRKAFKLIQIDY